VSTREPDVTRSKSVSAAVEVASEGTSASLDFFSSVIAGLILGLGVDWLAGSNPVATIIGVVVGFAAGFYKLWKASEVLEEQAEQRRRR
jgi:F0F1-type ATP synthase assembly protein I